MVSTPKPPDPMQTAQAQQGMNRQTAITSQLLNQTNQVTPDGSLTYSQTGNNFVADPAGQTYYRNKTTGEYSTSAPMITQGGTAGGATNPYPAGSALGQQWAQRNGGNSAGKSKSVADPNYEMVKGVYTPQFTATTTLSPQQQAIKAQSDAATLNIATLAKNQSGFLTDYLAKPFEYTNKDAENFAYDLGKRRIDPRFATELDSQRTQLINSGIRPGTPAYDQAMTQFNQSKNDAYNELTLGSQQLGYNQALTTRNQPLNEISALMSGSQVSQPQFQQTPQTNVAGVDYAGMVNQNYQAKLQQSQSAMGGLFGLAAAPFSMFSFKSDRRVKKDIKLLDTLRNGLGWYEFRYLEDGDQSPLRYGVMSDEVRKVLPSAVGVSADGFDFVDYDQVLEAAYCKAVQRHHGEFGRFA